MLSSVQNRPRLKINYIESVNLVSKSLPLDKRVKVERFSNALGNLVHQANTLATIYTEMGDQLPEVSKKLEAVMERIEQLEVETLSRIQNKVNEAQKKALEPSKISAEGGKGLVGLAVA